MFPAALAGELEAHDLAADRDMPLPHRRQPEALVVACVLAVADPDGAVVEQPNDGGDDLFARHPGQRQVARDPFAEPGERPAEVDHPAVLRLVPNLAPARVVAVLLAAPRVAAGGLDVAARARADPDVGPGRRDGERADPVQALLLADGLAFGRVIGEALPGSLAADPGRGVADVAKAGRPGRLDLVIQFLRCRPGVGRNCHGPKTMLQRRYNFKSGPAAGRVPAQGAAAGTSSRSGRRPSRAASSSTVPSITQ